MNMKSVTVLKIAVIFCTVLLIALAAGAPWLTAWYGEYRHMTEKVVTAITVTFYLCFVPAFIALEAMFFLLRNIGKKHPFDRRNTVYLKVISWCCLAVFLICGVSGYWYKPLFFVSASMLFLFMTVRVVCTCFSAASKLQEENDLTV